MTEIRPAVEADIEGLARLMADPGIRRWWGDTPAADLREQLPAAFAILDAGELIGWLAYEEETWFQGPCVAFDVAIADRYTGHGRGRAALRLAVAHFAARGHHRFTIDPAVANTPAVRAYTAAGFTPVGVMRASSRVHRDDAFEDDLLMELIVMPPETP